MRQNRCFIFSTITTSALFLSACGTVVPDIKEAWEPVKISEQMELRIKQKIFCDIIDGVRYVNNRLFIPDTPSQKPIPDTYGVQLQYNLTIEETGGFSPSASFNRTLANAKSSGVTVGQSLSVGAGLNISSTATRTDTFYSYYNIGKIAAPNANAWCHDEAAPLNLDGSSPLLTADLGIQRFLVGAVKSAAGVPSSEPPKGKKDLKLDVYSYEVKFVVLSNANVTPTFRLVSVSANTGSQPFLSAGRTRTHDLVITFGPSEIIPGSGIVGPTSAAQQTHFFSQLNQSLQSPRLLNPF